MNEHLGNVSIENLKLLEEEALLVAPHSNYFYPISRWVAEIMVNKANIQPNATVLEPSAGAGILCEYIQKCSSNLHCVEQFYLNQLILTLKGYLVVWDDFLTYYPSKLYSRIIANPPFPAQELHITHAYYHCLAPSGRLVFLMSNAAFEAKHGYYQKFRKWFELVGGISIRMPEELYVTASKGSDVKCYLAIIDKIEPHPLHQIYRIREARPPRGYFLCQ